MMRASIHAKLLTNAYFGGIRPIEGGEFSYSLLMPSLYTVGGALVTKLLEYDIKPEQFIEKINDEKIKIYGIYLYDKQRHYVPITTQVIDKDCKLNINNLTEVTYYASTSELHKEVRIPVMKGLSSEKRKKSYFIDLNAINYGVVKSNISINIEVRTRTALDYSTKVPDEGKLFSLSMVHKPDIEYCIDVELPDEYMNRLRSDYRWVGHLGGESGLAEFNVCDDTPLMDIIEKSSRTGKYLATSHIPLKLIDDELYTPLGKVRYIIGRVTMLGGWDIRSKVMKKIYACIEPGSIFGVDNVSRFSINSEEWYLKLLRSAIPI